MRRLLPGFRPSTWIACAALVILFAAPSLSAKPQKKSHSDEHSKAVVFEKEFPLGKDGNLVVDVGDMDVILETGNGGNTSVAVYVSGGGRDDAAGYFDEMRFETRLDGNTLEINSRDPAHEGWKTWFGTRHPRVWMIVSINRDTNIEIKTNDGDIQIGEVSGNASVHTEDGDIEIEKIDGASIKISTEDGDVDAETLRGDDVSIETEDGDINVDDLTAKRADVNTEDGDIVLLRVESGVTIIELEDGDLEIVVSGDRLQINCVDGDVGVALLRAMEADIEIDDGDVDLTLPKDTGFDLDLGGGDVTIRSKLSVEGRVSDEALRGSVNGGGPLVRVTGNDGSIVVREK